MENRRFEDLHNTLKGSADIERILTRVVLMSARPRDLSEYVGQDHILGEGMLLRRAVEADRFSSLIFYGPPGTGKTSLAKVITNTSKSRFINLS